MEIIRTQFLFQFSLASIIKVLNKLNFSCLSNAEDFIIVQNSISQIISLLDTKSSECGRHKAQTLFYYFYIITYQLCQSHLQKCLFTYLVLKSRRIISGIGKCYKYLLTQLLHTYSAIGQVVFNMCPAQKYSVPFKFNPWYMCNCRKFTYCSFVVNLDVLEHVEISSMDE